MTYEVEDMCSCELPHKFSPTESSVLIGKIGAKTLEIKILSKN
jgi:hypothetical protein